MKPILLGLLVSGGLCAQEATLPDTTLSALPLIGRVEQTKAALGRRLFYDTILSATGDTSCATCHDPKLGWADGKAFATGPNSALQPLSRNTPTILNVAYGKTMFWDSRVDTLEAQALVPILTPGEMLGHKIPPADALTAMVKRVQSVEHYRTAFGDHVTAEGIASAIADFERTLVTPDTPFDRFMRGDKSAMTPLQQRGMEVFHRAGCSLCHNGPMLSDYKLHVIGVVDGTTARTEWRTPSLRNLRYTSPYMHNGSERTIADVLLFYVLLMDRVSETLDGGDKTTLPPLDPLLQKLHLLPGDHEPLSAFLDALNADKLPE